jgi:hypothetical protein
LISGLPKKIPKQPESIPFSRRGCSRINLHALTGTLALTKHEKDFDTDTDWEWLPNQILTTIN